MKPANYFPLLANHYTSTKSLNIRRKYGLQGYAVYLIILQKLSASKTRKIKMDEVEELAFDLHLEQNEEELKHIIENYFEMDGLEFYSQELNDSLSWFDEKYNKASEGGKKAAANMTKEQLIERSRYANEQKKKKKESQIKPQNQGGNGDSLNILDKNDKKDLTPLGDSPNKEIKQNRKEIKRTETNITKEINNGISEIEPDFYFSPMDVQNSMENYISTTSRFFYGDHKNIVYNSYLDYYNHFPMTELSIEKFEEILYFNLLILTMSLNVNDLNDYLSKNPISIQAFEINNIIRIINENSKNKLEFKRIIDEVISNKNDEN